MWQRSTVAMYGVRIPLASPKRRSSEALCEERVHVGTELAGLQAGPADEVDEVGRCADHDRVAAPLQLEAQRHPGLHVAAASDERNENTHDAPF
jgi:hypothetical protein